MSLSYPHKSYNVNHFIKLLSRVKELNDRRVSYIQESNQLQQKIQHLAQSATAMSGAIDDTEFWFRNIAQDIPLGSEMNVALDTKMDNK